MLTKPSLTYIEYICFRLREVDKVEILALARHDSLLQMAWEHYHAIEHSGRGVIGWHNGLPAGVAALVEIRKGVWEVWMFGTDNFKSVVFELSRWFRKEIPAIVRDCDGHRLQCDSRCDHKEAEKLIRGLGGEPEGPPMRRYGKDKADYQRFVWHLGENDAFVRPLLDRED